MKYKIEDPNVMRELHKSTMNVALESLRRNDGPEDKRNALIDAMKSSVDGNAYLEEINCDVAEAKGFNKGMWFGGAAAILGFIIGGVIDTYVKNKK